MKYIIELEDEPMGKFEEDENYYRCKQIPYWSLSESMINKLTPYTNIDIKEKAEEFGRGYDAGWDAGSKFHEAEKESIEDEVWEFVNFLENKLKASDYDFIFDDNSPYDKYTYQEAKSKYEAWKKQKDEIHVGDEVKHRGLNYVVGYVGADDVYHLIDKNWLRTVVQGGYQLIKTGRHFPEVAKLLEKMRKDMQLNWNGYERGKRWKSKT